MGTNLGAGDSWQARCSALTVLAGVPVFWAVGAVAYLTPAVQRVCFPHQAAGMCRVQRQGPCVWWLAGTGTRCTSSLHAHR